MANLGISKETTTTYTYAIEQEVYCPVGGGLW
jgi:hypothetical protein